MGILSCYSRPMPCSRLHLRRETEFGRYVAANLLSAQWASRMLNQKSDSLSETYNLIREMYIMHNPYTA